MAPKFRSVAHEHTLTVAVQFDQEGFIRMLVSDERGTILNPECPWSAYMGDASECLASTVDEFIPDSHGVTGPRWVPGTTTITREAPTL